MPGTDLSVYITSYAGACGLLQTPAIKGGGSFIWLRVFSYNTQGKPAPAINPGTYTFTGPDDSTPDANGNAITGSVEVNGFDGSCARTMHLQASTTAKSTITLTDTNARKGTFDVTLDSGDHLTGTFDAPNCDVSGVPKGPQTPACK